ncbi:amidohydrolase 2 [Niveomyces insectorum RCEF 264]|uniref:dihydroorotase n=1 Tax=Niveomyces insectorum RCEF 264 TaxID=1081102 RepID=A0A162J2K7_9HYPO|nr:amidohydrolase 2 [Niveomyces insectorum RCEF 264]
MHLQTVQRIELPPTADMHVHMRQGDLMQLVVPTVRQGGVDTAYVPARRCGVLVPPELTKRPGAAVDLHASVTPEVIAKAAAAGISGVKLYPQGVTTNSDAGVANMEAFYDTFAAMDKHGLILNIHGEVLESLAPPDTTLEEAFLPTLKSLHERFPGLRIVLEHCSTAAAVEAVKACGPTVGATITAHHLYLTTDDACCDPFAFCKPIPKKATDRDVLIRTIAEGNPKFFFGSDSAPHPLHTKTAAAPGKAPAGVFTQPYATQLVLLGLQEGIARGVIAADAINEDKLARFLSHNGRRFYGLPETTTGPAQKIVLERRGATIPTSVRSADGSSAEVGVSRAGAEVFSLRWERA